MNLTEQDLKLDSSSDGRELGGKATMHLPIVICTIDDLDTLLQASRTRRRLPKGQFTLAISGFNEKERLSIQRNLNAYAHSCGCTEGGIFALTALAVAITYSVFNVLHGAWFGLIIIWLAGLVLIPLCAGIGKLIGQFVARLRFRRMCILLIRSLRPEALLA
jgi:hypothetical protein